MKSALPSLCVAFSLIAGASAADRSAATKPAAPSAEQWRRIATVHDRDRLRKWRTAWTEALAKARSSGHRGEIDQEGTLLLADAALPWRDPPPGIYSCRTIKLGAQSSGLLDYVAYPPFDCRIRSEAGLMRFAKLTGSQRPIGRLLPYMPDRMVFLGTLELGDETRALDYGHDRDRDLVGILERIGELRWRLVFPYPHFESTIDVLELVPKG